MTVLLAILFLPGWLTPGACLASQFGGSTDRLAGGPTACSQLDPARLERGVAHRTLPCGTRLVLADPATGRTEPARVVDRGPYGALDGRRWVVKRRPTDPGAWRGCLDLAPSTNRRLRGRVGFGPILYWVSP